MAPRALPSRTALMAEDDDEAPLPEAMLIFAGRGWQRSKSDFWRRRCSLFLSASPLRNRAKGEARGLCLRRFGLDGSANRLSRRRGAS